MVRAFAIRFMEQLNFEDFDISEEYSRQRDMYIYIDSFTGLLRKYEKTDDCFEKFYLSNLEKQKRNVEEKQEKHIIYKKKPVE